METNKLSGIVVYTIHNNSTLRDALREALKLKMQAYEIDESTYGVPIPGILLEQVKKLKKICEDVAKEVKTTIEIMIMSLCMCQPIAKKVEIIVI